MDEENFILEVFDCVAEMTTDPAGLVPIPAALVSEVAKGDDDPKFATFVIESGWSKSRRYWGPEIFQSVAEQMENSGEPLVGYMGHIRPEDDPYTFPEIQLQWLKGKLIQAGDKTKLAVKAYVLPGTKGRDYLGRGLVRTVSWRGKAAQIPFQKGVKITQYAIESIDLARPRAAGMSAQLVGGLTSEMNEGGSEVKPEEIAALSANELRAHNSGLVATIEAEARKPLEDKVAEMENSAAAAKPGLDLIPDLRKALGLEESADVVAVIQATLKHFKEQGKSLRDAVLNSVLDKKLKGDDANKALVKRVLVGEMKDREFQLSGDTDADEKKVGEMLNEIIDSSDDLKKMVSEMEQVPPAVPATTPPVGGNSEGFKPGQSTANVRVRSVG